MPPRTYSNSQDHYSAVTVVEPHPNRSLANPVLITNYPPLGETPESEALFSVPEITMRPSHKGNSREMKPFRSMKGYP